jgi:outer membrane biosynthesis protein TonB
LTASEARRGEPESFGLIWALVISVAVHLLLILLSIWAPLRAKGAQKFELPEETTIEFSFVNPQDTDADEPAGDLPPAPTPPRPAAIPDVVPQGEPEADLSPDTIEVPPEIAEPPLPEQLEPVEQQPPEEQVEPTEPLDETMPETTDQSGREEAAKLPDDPSGQTLRGTDTPPQAAQPERERLDVSRALRDFGRTVSRGPNDPRQPSSSGGGTPNNVFVPDLSALPTTGFGMGNLRFESTDFDWSDYGRQIYMAIWRAWHNRLHVTTNEFDKWAHQERTWYLDHSAAVRFVIERSGQVTGIAIEGASGCQPLDQSAVDALEEVLLPPLPAAFPRDREVVHARFITQGDVRTMKEILAHYKRMGLF